MWLNSTGKFSNLFKLQSLKSEKCESDISIGKLIEKERYMFLIRVWIREIWFLILNKILLLNKIIKIFKTTTAYN